MYKGLLVVAVVVTTDNSDNDNDNGKNGTKMKFITYVGHVTSSNSII